MRNRGKFEGSTTPFLIAIVISLVSFGWQAPDARADLAAQLPEPKRKVEFSSGVKGSGDKIHGYIYAPKGKGPFPAVVILPGCAEITKNQLQWGARLADWGYTALVVDSLGPRGIENKCPIGVKFSSFRWGLDAYGSLRYLQSLKSIRREKIGILSWGLQAGEALLLSLMSSPTDPTKPSPLFSVGENLRFKVGVAIYPKCGVSKKSYYAPLMILVGEKDQSSPAARCSRKFLTEKTHHVGKSPFIESKGGGKPIRIKVFPGATFGFDAGVNGTVELQPVSYSPAAEAKSVQAVKSFLAGKL